MEEVLSFFWIVWFTRLELGGSNGGIGFHVNDPSSPFWFCLRVIIHIMIQILSLHPPATALSGSQQCYAKGSYGSHTTSQYISLSFWCPSLLLAWTGCPDAIHIFSVLCLVGWFTLSWLLL
jgi:hypothetical protein